MAAAFIQSASNADANTAVTTNSFNSSATGSTIIVTATKYNTATVQFNSVSDNKGNSYTLAVHQTQGSGSQCVDIWYSSNVVGGVGHTVTGTSIDSGSLTVTAQEVSGLVTSSALDTTASTSGFTTTPSSGNTAATGQANEFVVGAVVFAVVSGSGSVGAGFSNYYETSVGVAHGAMESKVVAATGVQAATFTLSTTAAWACAVATFKAAATTNTGNFFVAAS